jgi:hypothetical protein
MHRGLATAAHKNAAPYARRDAAITVLYRFCVNARPAGLGARGGGEGSGDAARLVLWFFLADACGSMSVEGFALKLLRTDRLCSWRGFLGRSFKGF